MASKPNNDKSGTFDVKAVEDLIGLMAKHELTEVSIVAGANRIRLRKGGVPVAMPTMMPSAVHHAAPQAVSPINTAPAAPTKKLHEIKSVMVGTFYSRPKPDKDDFVKVGSTIKPDTTVCLVEAMKIFNDIKAECSGTIAEVCVKNGDGVDFGTVLFRVEM
ncbi:MAG: acetyl-CoA carboxylase biotin carboxyl carrier protein [Fimbriiglobus sp.]